MHWKTELISNESLLADGADKPEVRQVSRSTSRVDTAASQSRMSVNNNVEP